MLAAVCIGSNDLPAAGQFYDTLLDTLSMTRLVSDDVELGYGPHDGEADFWVLKPHDGNAATCGNGSQVTFLAQSPAQVDAFHATALSNGGSDEGAPGPRDYAPGYYGAYCRDREGHKLHVYVISQ